VSTDKTTSGAGRRGGQFVATHARQLKPLPEPPETFLKRDLPERTQALFDRLTANDYLDRVGTDEAGEVYRWRVPRPLYDAIQRFADSPSPGQRVSPCCRYRGFSNLRDGGFECGLCGGEFDDFHIVEEGESDE